MASAMILFESDALEVAEALVGCELAANGVRVRITEVEAYRWPGDTANHARAGRTARNAPMWGPPGHLYVYLCYGLHHMLNLVTNAEGQAAAVLIRAAEPVDGLALIEARRGGARGPALLTGPGRVAAGLGLRVAHSGEPIGRTVELGARPSTPRLARGPRIGIDYAAPEHRAAPWRVADADSRWVARRRELVPDAP